MALPSENSERILLLEGTDDEHVVKHLCISSGFTKNFDIVQKGGFSELSKSIPVELAVPDRLALGVVADVNDNLASRWQAVRDRCESRKITLPSQPAHGGVVVEGQPRVGVWLMPDNQHSGQLEDLIAALIPEGDIIWPLAQKFVEGIPEAERPKPIIKAQVGAWLAARTSARPMGSAIGTGHLNASAPAAASFINWLKRLFQVPALEGP